MKKILCCFSIMLFLCAVLCSCDSKAHVAKTKTSSYSSNYTKQENKSETVKETVKETTKPASVAVNETTAVAETSAQNTTANTNELAQKEAILTQYISKVGGQEAIEYNENLYSVKSSGKMHVFNADGMIDVNITLPEYLDFAINDIKTKYPDIDQRNGADWEYVSLTLNLPDFSTYESAFYGCDDDFWANGLTGKFANKDEIDMIYNAFIKLNTMSEKATFLRTFIDSKNQAKVAETKTNAVNASAGAKIGDTKRMNGHTYEYQNTPSGNRWVDLDEEEERDDSDDEDDYDYDEDYDYDDDYSYNNSNYNSYNDYDYYENYDISQQEYTVKDNYPKKVLRYNEADGHSYSDMSLPSIYSSMGNQLVSFQSLTNTLDIRFQNNLYDFSKENHVCEIEFDSSEITSQTNSGITVTVYGTVYWTEGDTKDIEVYCKCDKNFTPTTVTYELK